MPTILKHFERGVDIVATLSNRENKAAPVYSPLL